MKRFVIILTTLVFIINMLIPINSYAIDIFSGGELDEYTLPLSLLINDNGNETVKNYTIQGYGNKKHLKKGDIFVSIDDIINILGVYDDIPVTYMDSYDGWLDNYDGFGLSAGECDSVYLLSRGTVTWTYNNKTENQYVLVDLNTGTGNYFEALMLTMQNKHIDGFSYSPYPYWQGYPEYLKNIVFNVNYSWNTRVSTIEKDDELLVSLIDILYTFGIDIDLWDENSIK